MKFDLIFQKDCIIKTKYITQLYNKAKPLISFLGFCKIIFLEKLIVFVLEAIFKL